MRDSPRELLRHRHLLRQLLLCDLRLRYRGAWLGILWTLLEPLGLVAIYSFVLGFIARFGGRDYPLTILMALLPWSLFAGIVQEGTSALTRERQLIRKIYFPRSLLVWTEACSQSIRFAIGLVVVIAALWSFGVAPTARLLWLPVPLLLLVSLATGIAFLMTLANTLTRDFEPGVRMALRVLFYASPVVYPASAVPPEWRALYFANPLAALLTVIRSILRGDPLELSPALLAAVALACVATLALGIGAFARFEPRAVKLL